MSKLNYSRPNNGYELEPWRKTTQAARQDTKPMIVLEHQALGHEIKLCRTKPGSVHLAAYRCVNCDLHLAWAKK